MRLGVIGGSGHHRMLGLYYQQLEPDLQVAIASDGFDEGDVPWIVESVKATKYDDAAAMLDMFKPDIVSVGAVYGHNHRFIVECLKRDIPTVSDKPVAATWEQLASLRNLLVGTRRILITEFPFRSDPAFRAARDAVRNGKLGHVVLATAQKSYRFGHKRPKWYANRDDYTGTILWVASHAIDIIHFTTGLNYTEVFGRHGNLSKPDFGTMEDYTTSLFALENGASAIVHADYLRPDKAPTHGDDRLRIAGASGVVEVRDGRCVMMTHDEPPRDITDEAVTKPAAVEMLEALHGSASAYYSTHATLTLANVLLHARDAADQQAVISITG